MAVGADVTANFGRKCLPVAHIPYKVGHACQCALVRLDSPAAAPATRPGTVGVATHRTGPPMMTTTTTTRSDDLEADAVLGVVDDEADGGIPEDELAAEALAAPPADVAADDAVSWWDLTDRGDLGLLPAWYMPTAAAGTRRLTGWKRTLAWTLVLLFVAINAAGLCSTYGRVLPANL